MQDSTIIKRISREDDPRRCNHIIQGKGQCINVSVEGGNFCLVHGGNKILQAKAKSELRNYRLTRNKARLIELGNSSGIKSLRDEIAILRILLEERFNAITNDNELILQSGAMSEMIMKIERVVTSCQKLEERTGIMLDKAQVMNIAEQIIDIITNNISDPVIVEKISADIAEVFTKNTFDIDDEEE